MSDSSYELLVTQPDVQCLVCTRPFTLDTEVTNSFEALAICRECKMTVLGDNNRDETTRTYRQRRQRSRAVPHQQASYSSTPNRSQRWHTSDDESDGINYADSVFDEIESNISFGDYDGGSDASLDQYTTMSREIAIQLESESYMNTDTDIDPMNAGIDHWDSDDLENEEDVQSEESGFDEAVDTMQQQQHWHDIAASGLSEQESEDVVWTWRTPESQGESITNLREELEGPQIRRLFVGNPGDYADARRFEMLLNQFAEDNNSRRGAPPAATSFIENLPSVVLSTIHETNSSVICAVCKDPMPLGTRAKQLPCMHLYHSSCILPWLSSRNTCPVCRYELPTDDPEYERTKHVATNERDMHGRGNTWQQGVIEDSSDEVVVEGTPHTSSDAEVEANTGEHVHAAQQPDRERGRTRWLFIAATPVISLVGLALVMCLTNPGSSGRRLLWRRSQNTTVSHANTKRSWWCMF
ncbi:unnamed protein product [Urochloa decumbens]|uniref:RING-type E3 ubiquitin transferase n=1 Tax=Urochloa decumbens TaxID=240449 RepID=A0ABC8YBJ1_9POAL